MGYVAIKGGEQAIDGAETVMDYLRTLGAETDEQPLDINQIQHQLHFLHSGVLGEGGLYDEELASLAIKQSLGDPLEAAFFMRAYRCTRPRILETRPLDTSKMRLVRRISAAFKEIPGGQMLGATPDYTQRLFNFELIDESAEAFKRRLRSVLGELGGINSGGVPDSIPKVVEFLRMQGLVAPLEKSSVSSYDITRKPIVFPLPRSARLAMMARSQTGSILALAYSNMRGYGDVHPTVAELRVGYLPVEIPHPYTGELIEAGEILMTECEIVTIFRSDGEGSKPTLGLGFGACYGHNESKAISMAILDRALQIGEESGPKHPSEDAEFVLSHIDGVESMGFCVHYKMPHYVTFQSDLDRLRMAQQKHAVRSEHVK